jgi:transmembrane sensor
VESVTDFDWQLFDRYLAGDLTPDERATFERWLEERPGRASQAAAFRRAIEIATTEVSAADREAMWASIVRAPAALESRRPKTSHSFDMWKATGSRRKAVALAAGVVLAAGAALADRSWRDGSSPQEASPLRVVSVPRAQQAEFRLPDGSAVILAGGSSLRHPRVFAEDSREVWLEGEATFRVQHSQQRPFRVRAGDLVATDVGTEFLVRAYPEDRSARVVVRSGVVELAPAKAPVILRGQEVVRAGQQGRLDPNGIAIVQPADTAASFAWTRGTLMFDETPLSEALPQLSRWYDLEFQLADSTLGSIPLSGTIDRSLSEARLHMLAASLGLQERRSGSVVRLARPPRKIP